MSLDSLLKELYALDKKSRRLMKQKEKVDAVMNEVKNEVYDKMLKMGFEPKDFPRVGINVVNGSNLSISNNVIRGEDVGMNCE